ncbi:MAG: hypothetical protein RLZZ628_292 [Bacteroidota bacterium]|jgi:SAM-dependent methyltransferase
MFHFIQDWVQRKIFRSRKARWNHQYAQGQWDGLKDASELERQQIIKDFFMKFKPMGSMLEFGCGFGLLPEVVFQKKGYSQYVGVDVSDFVIEKIQNLSTENCHFEAGDMEKYVFKTKFDAIIFSECIYYANDILKLIADCQQQGLKKDGIFIISLHEFKRSAEIWRDLQQHLTLLESKTVVNERSRWQIAVLK